MEITPVRITATPEWKALVDHFAKLRDVHLRDLFAEDPHRGESMTVEASDLLLDYSKNRLTAETVRLLVAVAERAGLHERTEAMFSGEHINVTEDRAVLHVALRAPKGVEIDDEGHIRAGRPDREMAWVYGQRDKERHQYRHRRL